MYVIALSNSCKRLFETNVVASSFTAQSVLVQPPRDALRQFTSLAKHNLTLTLTFTLTFTFTFTHAIVHINAEKFLWRSKSTWQTQRVKKIVNASNPPSGTPSGKSSTKNV